MRCWRRWVLRRRVVQDRDRCRQHSFPSTLGAVSLFRSGGCPALLLCASFVCSAVASR
jgi:hypothetical protein